MDTYGGAIIPAIPADTVEALWADLLQTNTDVIENAAFDIVPRVDVNQGPVLKVSDAAIFRVCAQVYESRYALLLQLTCTLNFNVDRPEAMRALENIRSSVKLGTYRVTLVIQELTDTAEVTINAGTSYP